VIEVLYDDIQNMHKECGIDDLYAYFECRRKVLLSLFQNLTLSPKIRKKAYLSLIYLPLSSSITKRRNHCSITGRSRAIYRHFGRSRLIFRKLA